MMDDEEYGAQYDCGSGISVRRIRFGIDRHPETGHQSGRCESTQMIAFDEASTPIEAMTQALLEGEGGNQNFMQTGECDRDGEYLVVVSDQWNKGMMQITEDIRDEVDQYWYCEQHAQEQYDRFIENHSECGNDEHGSDEDFAV